MSEINRPSDLRLLTIDDDGCLDDSPDCVKFIDLNGDLLHMNKAGCEALSVQEPSAHGLHWLSLLPASVAPAGNAALNRALAGELNRALAGETVHFIAISAGGEIGTRFWDNLLTPIKDASGSTHEIICISRDITDQHGLQAELLAVRKSIAEHDTSSSLAQSGSDELSTMHAQEVRLSGRETECLYWTAAGKTASETAQIMCISRRTIEFHLASAIRKLNASNKIQAAVIAARLGLLDQER